MLGRSQKFARPVSIVKQALLRCPVITFLPTENDFTATKVRRLIACGNTAGQLRQMQQAPTRRNKALCSGHQINYSAPLVLDGYPIALN